MNRQNKHLIIHGHFYQPPRENPWLGSIEKQPGAAPFHDWNEKIYYECYRPNSVSRILGDNLYIKEMVNNFEYLSFNVGPTLMHWLEKRYPVTYTKILEADQISRERNNGYGNAMAQVYNHMILPLANKRDQITQILWGIEDFVYHFNRQPEGMWLAETAINEEVVESLIECNIKFTVLSPFQALKTRNIGKEKWSDLPTGVDSSVPYRIFSKINPQKYLDVFFYEPELAKAIAFEGILNDAQRFHQGLRSKISKKAKGSLLNIAVDGETFGHHKPFGDMCLSYFFLNNSAEFTITNYAQYLKISPPEQEVMLYAGEKGKGSSWSCSHGVGRWERNCGCKGSHDYPADQSWRSNLRQGFDELRDELCLIYLSEIQKYSESDPWEIRNNYINLRLRPQDTEVEKDFFEKFFYPNLSDKDQRKILKLMECQYYANLMYTSCAWFFDDLGGIEPVQNLKYAYRAIEYVHRYTEENLLTILIRNLAQTKSYNLKLEGVELLEKHVVKKKVERSVILAGYLLNHHLLHTHTDEFYCQSSFQIDIKKSLHLQLDPVTLFLDHMIFHNFSLHSREQFFTITYLDIRSFSYRCILIPITSRHEQILAEKLEDELTAFQKETSVIDLLDGYRKKYKLKMVYLEDLTTDLRRAFMNVYFSKNAYWLTNHLHKNLDYLDNILKQFLENGMQPTQENKSLIKSFTRILLFRKMEDDDFSLELAKKVIFGVKQLKIETKFTLLSQYFSDYLARLLKDADTPESCNPHLQKVIEIFETIESGGIPYDKTLLQDRFFHILREYERKITKTPTYLLCEPQYIKEMKAYKKIADFLHILTPKLDSFLKE